VAVVRGLLGPDEFSEAFNQGALGSLETLPFGSADGVVRHLR
jgi:hypothetical protein